MKESFTPMENYTQRLLRLVLLTASFTALVGVPLACGGVKKTAAQATEAVASVADAAKTKMDAAVAAANDYIEKPQIDQRKSQCLAYEGRWVENIAVGPCTAGEAVLRFDGTEEKLHCDTGTGEDSPHVCLYRDGKGRAFFDDGPSTPASAHFISGISDSYDLARWGLLFWPAAVNHDYCYHHNPITRGLSQQDCDMQMLSDLSAVCETEAFKKISWFDQDVCHKNAALAFATVRGCGDKYYAVQNTLVDYPQWEPLWRKYGLEHDAMDFNVIKDVDEVLKFYNPCAP
jgi:hypothetical protein